MRCHVWPQISWSKVKVTTLVYIFWIPRYRFSTYRHHTQVSAIYSIYYQRYHIECVMSCVTLNFKIKGQGHNHEIYLLEFPVIYLVIGDTKKNLCDIYYQRYHIECVTSCLTLKIKDQGHNMGIYLFEFPNINLVGIDTQIAFLSHRHQEILNIV